MPYLLSAWFKLALCAIYGHRLELATIVREDWDSMSRKSIAFLDHGLDATNEFVEVSFAGPSDAPRQLLVAANSVTISHHAACSRCGKINWRS